MPFTAVDPDYVARVRDSFSRQRVMQTLGAELTRVDPGEVEIVLPFRADLTQQHGFLHAGVVITVLDSALGYAAYSLMPPGHAVLSVEIKTNLLAPAKGDRLVAVGRVVRAGRTLTVCLGEGWMERADGREQVALMTATMIGLPDRE